VGFELRAPCFLDMLSALEPQPVLNCSLLVAAESGSFQELFWLFEWALRRKLLALLLSWYLLFISKTVLWFL
jgi:hypothetical protein